MTTATVLQVGGDSTVYGLVLFLHIITAIVGLGGVMLNGIYAQQAQQRPGREGVAINQANFAVSKIAEIFIYFIFVFGVLLVLLADDDTISFSDLWISLSMLFFIIAIGLSHGVMNPAIRKANALAEELATTEGRPPGQAGPPPQAVELEALGKRIGATGAVLNLLILVMLYLMIFKPGFP